MTDSVCGHEWKMEVEVISLESLSHIVGLCEVTRSVFKFTFPKKRQSHFPLVYVKFVDRIDSHPQHLISDKAGEIKSKKFDSLLLVKGFQDICLPRATITV
jgi:hypothetical protein